MKDETKTKLAECITFIRLDRLQTKSKEAGRSDVMLYLFLDVYDKYHKIATEKNQLEKMPSFIQEVLFDVIFVKVFS